MSVLLAVILVGKVETFWYTFQVSLLYNTPYKTAPVRAVLGRFTTGFLVVSLILSVKTIGK